MVTFYPFVDHAVPDVSGLSACEQFPRPAPPVKINGVLLVGDMTSEQLHLASADDMKAVQDAIDDIEGTVSEQGNAISQIVDDKQDSLSEEQLANIAAVPDKADEDDLPYALVTLGKWERADSFGGEYGDPVWHEGNWYLESEMVAAEPPEGLDYNALRIVFRLGGEDIVYARASLPGHLCDRAVNVVAPTVIATEEWVWSEGETGTPVYSGGYWTVENPNFDYDGPVAGLDSDTEITFPYTEAGSDTPVEHVVTKTTIYGPTLTLTMPSAVEGHVRDLIARIDLSQAAGAPPVAFAGGTFETANGKMPVLVVGINLLSFTETDEGVFGVAYKQMKPLSAQGGS